MWLHEQAAQLAAQLADEAAERDAEQDGDTLTISRNPEGWTEYTFDEHTGLNVEDDGGGGLIWRNTIYDLKDLSALYPLIRFLSDPRVQ